MSHSAQDLAASRARAPHTSMFLRMLVRAAILRRGRAASALFAMVVAAAVATAMLNLYVDVQAKLRREFRNYGANIIVAGKDGAPLPANALSAVDSALSGRGIAAPFGLVVARTADGQPIVVAGTDFDRVKQLDKWWSVSQLAFGFEASSNRRAGFAGGRAQKSAVRSHLSGTNSARNSSGLGADRRRRRQPHLCFAGRLRRMDRRSAFDYRNCGERFSRRSGEHHEPGDAGTSGCRRTSGAADHGRGSTRARQDTGYAAGCGGADHSDRRVVRAFHIDGMGLRPATRLRHHESLGRFGTLAERVLRSGSCSARRNRRI